MRSRCSPPALINATRRSFFPQLLLSPTKVSHAPTRCEIHSLVVKRQSERCIRLKLKSSLTKEVVDALDAYKVIYGNIDVKASFVVPSESPEVKIDPRWPVAARGLRLGSRLSDIRAEYKFGYLDNQKGTNKAVQFLLRRLDKLGFVLCKRAHQTKLLRLALQTYKTMFGDLNITKFFTCPANDPRWPEITWGTKLGFMVGNIRHKGNFPELIDELQAMGIVFAPSLDRRAAESTLLAVDRFYELYGHFKIPLEFQVPAEGDTSFKKRSEMVSKHHYSEDRKPYRAVTPHPYSAWPAEVRGMKLGFKFANIYYSRGNLHLREILDAKGAFDDMKAAPSLWSRSDQYKVTLQALREYKLNYGHLNVPVGFVVPSGGEDDTDPRSSSSSNSTRSNDPNIKGERDISSSTSISSISGCYSSGHDVDVDSLGVIKETPPLSVPHTPHTDHPTQKFNDNSLTPGPSLDASSTIVWSKKSLGLKLGLKVRDLRFKARYLAKNRAELEIIGFDWKYVETVDGADHRIEKESESE